MNAPELIGHACKDCGKAIGATKRRCHACAEEHKRTRDVARILTKRQTQYVGAPGPRLPLGPPSRKCSACGRRSETAYCELCRRPGIADKPGPAKPFPARCAQGPCRSIAVLGGYCQRHTRPGAQA